jgi:hypothetical protein
MNRRKKLTVGILLVLTLLLAGVSIYVGLNVGKDQSGEDSFAADNNCCEGTNCANYNGDWGAGYTACVNGQCSKCQGGGPICGNGSCQTGENSTTCPTDCTGGSNTGSTANTSGGSTTKCSTTAPTATVCFGDEFGKLEPYDNGTKTCRCTKTTGNACACVPTSGTSCTDTRTSLVAGESGCSAVGGSCAKKNANGDVVTGVCQSFGNQDGGLKCNCAISGNSQPVTTGGTTSTTPAPDTCSNNRDSDCNVGFYCSGTTCTPKQANGATSTCSRGGQCLSNFCNALGDCQAQGTGTTPTCANDNGCAANQFCNEQGQCAADRGEGADCGRPEQCGSGLSCLSLRCRATNIDDSNPNTACISGKVYCVGDFSSICNGTSFAGNMGAGKMCNNGQLNADCTIFDACARFTTTQPLNSNVTSCQGVTRKSYGEPSKGGFVGCSGALNCFCGSASNSTTVGTAYTAADGNVQCHPDDGNDSCGAYSEDIPQTSTPTGSQTGSTTTTTSTSAGSTTSNPPPPPTPYCGDAVCRSGEFCERVSPGSGQFRVCGSNGVGPSGSLVEECRGIVNSAPSAAGACNYCGDGVVNGPEQCDYNAPNSEDCNEQCQNVNPVCLGLDENGPNPIRTGTGNYMEYVLRYTKAEVGDPFPNIKLRVGPAATPVGRDANTITSIIVSPNVRPSSTDTNTTKTYRFVWEAAQLNGSNVADGSYDVRVLLDGTEASLITTAACQKSLAVDSVAVQEPLFTVVKAGAQVCEADGDARIDYTITVRNIGPVEGVIDQVVDTLDSDIVSRNISPTTITPSFGTYASGVITWIGTVTDRTYAPNQTKTFTYSITIPESSVINFLSTGVSNQVVVRYDTPSTNDNTTSFDLVTDVTCQRTVVPYIPNTAFGDESTRYIMFALLFIIAGLITYRLRLGQEFGGKLARFIYIKSPLTSYENKVIVEEQAKKSTRTRRK